MGSTEWLAPKAVAEVLGVHRKTVTQWIAAGRLQAIRTPGGQLRINRAELERITEQPVEVAAA